MITAVIQHKNDTLVVVLPRANTDLQIKLLSIGVRTLPPNIQLFGGEDAEVDVQLASGSRVIRIAHRTQNGSVGIFVRRCVWTFTRWRSLDTDILTIRSG